MTVRRRVSSLLGGALIAVSSLYILVALIFTPVASAAYGPTPSTLPPTTPPSTTPPSTTPTTAPPAAPVTVPNAVASGSGSTGVLAFTGADVTAMVVVGSVAVGGGGALVLATRRRRSAAS